MSNDPSNPFDGEDLSGKHYRHANMQRAFFDGVNLAGAKFFAVLNGALFTDTNLANAKFDDVNLAGAHFNNVNLSGTSISNANLSGIKIKDATLAGLDIQNADLTGMRINGVLVADLFAAYEK